MLAHPVHPLPSPCPWLHLLTAEGSSTRELRGVPVTWRTAREGAWWCRDKHRDAVCVGAT
eukprot:scaffold58302_cov72-Phaeocystis_antarctica.AAC.9